MAHLRKMYCIIKIGRIPLKKFTGKIYIKILKIINRKLVKIINVSSREVSKIRKKLKIMLSTVHMAFY